MLSNSEYYPPHQFFLILPEQNKHFAIGSQWKKFEKQIQVGTIKILEKSSKARIQGSICTFGLKS